MTEARGVVAVLLAAGSSRRFGPTNKLTALYQGTPLVDHAAALIAGLGFAARIAVCADAAVAGHLHGFGFSIIANPDAERGMGSSLALGAVAAAKTGAEALMVFLADMPGVTAAHVAALLQAHDTTHPVATSSNGRRRMPPTVFDRRFFADLADLTGDEGARQWTGDATVVEASPELLMDIDTPGDLPQ